MNRELLALSQLGTLSEAMAHAANAGDWQTLTGHEAERRRLAESLPADLASTLPPAVQRDARRVIENCLACDAQVRRLVGNRLEELSVILRQTAGGG